MKLDKLVVSAALVALTACGPGGDGPPVQDTSTRSGDRRGGTLAVTNRADVDTLNDLISGGSTHGRDVERLLFLQLVRENPDFDQGPPTFGPQLAESWEFSEDRGQLTFHLRDLDWSDGTPLTADDVRWTWQAQIDPDVAWRFASRKKSIEDVEVIDPHTVRFHFSAAYADQLEDANIGAILPRHAWGRKPFAEWRSSGGWFTESIVTSGPFTVTHWEPNQELALERNQHYYKEGLPLIDRVVVRIVPEKSTQINQLLGGTLDYVRIVPPDQIERLEKSDRTEIDAYVGRAFDYLCWNTGHAALVDAAVRRALTLATDRQAIVDAIYRGYAEVSVTSVLSSTWGFDPSLESWPYDPREASRLLAGAGFEDRDGDGVLERAGSALSLELLVQSGNRVHQDAATLLQAQFKRVGVELEIRPIEFKSWVERVQGHDFDAAIGGWTIPTSLDMAFAFHTREIGKYNFGGYSNPELDRIFEAAELAESMEEKRDLLFQVQAVLHHEQPYTFLWEPLLLNGRSARVRDSRPNALSAYYDIDEWWLDDG